LALPLGSIELQRKGISLSLNVLIAPSGFKESLSPEEVADCIEAGILRAAPDATVRKLPLVDGGEGFTKTLVAATEGTIQEVSVTGPIGQRVNAHFGILGGRGIKTAVLEMASAAGLRLVPEGLRDPLYTTTYGVGELIKAALDANVERILIGCADSATNDGGCGMAQALGARLLDAAGESIGWGGEELIKLHQIDLSNLDPRIGRVKIAVTCNFNSLLCDPNGASRMFGPQKGASPRGVETLVAAIEHYAKIIDQQLGIDVRRMPGGGGAGGLAAGLHAFLNAELHHRYEIVMRFLDLETPLRNADLVITSEGCLDGSSARGKIPCEVGRRAKVYGHPVIALAGMIGKGAEAALEHGVDAFSSIIDAPMQQAAAFLRAQELLKKSAEHVMRAILVGQQLQENTQRENHRVRELSESAPAEGGSLERAIVGAMSEELRTPLNLVIGYSKMLKDGLLGAVNPEQEKALQQVIKHSYWVLMLMNGLLQSSGAPEKATPLPVADVLVSQLMPLADEEYKMSA
jgi:glycerate kinase